MFKKKAQDPLSAVQRIEALKVEPGDVVVVTVPASVSPETMKQARDLFVEAFKGIKTTVLVVQKGTEVSLVRSAAADLSADIPKVRTTTEFESLLSRLPH